MKSFSIFIIILCCFTLVQYKASAQQGEPVITARFDSLKASAFVLELEKQTGYRIYYDTTGFDSLSVTLFINTDLKYSMYNKQVFITKGVAITTTLP